MKFKSNEEGRCPICNSENLEYFGMELMDNSVYYPWHCPDCDTEGKEWYYANFSEVRDIDDNVCETEGMCPNCGCDGDIEYGTAELDGTSLKYEFHCPECENSGYEWYDLDFDSHTINGHENENIVMESKKIKTEATSYTDLVRAGEDLWRDGAVVKETNVEGIYDCYTNGHGGYLVDTDVHPELAKYGEKTYIDNIVGFEEDYEALKVIWAYPEVLSGKVQLNNDWYDKLTLDDVLKYEDSLNAEFRKEFPDKKPIPALSELGEAIDYKDDKITVTTAEDPKDDREYYGRNMTKRDKVRSLDQAKRNLDRMEKDPRVTQGQAVDQVSFDSALDTDLARYKQNKDMAKIDKAQGNDFWADEHNKTAKQFADKIRAKHKKQEISEGLEINNLQNKPIKAVEVVLGDESMLFNTANVRGAFVDARQFMIPFANKLNLEVEDIKNININVVYEDGAKSSVRIKPFDYQDTAYERYKALGGTEVFGQFQDWYSFNGYDEYGNKARRRKNSKLNGYANDGSQKRLSVENKKQEAIDNDEEELDIDFDDTISLLDMALSEIPTIGVEDWGKDDELLFIADTKVMFENLKNYEEEIPKYYYDNASNDDWSNGIDDYLEEIKGVDINNGDSDNTYNWNAPVTHDVEFTIYEADDGCYFKGSIHIAGDVRGNYTTEFLLKFNDKDDCLETLFDTCSENCYRNVTVDGVDYTVSPHFFNEYVDIWNSETQESYDDVYCTCIEELKKLVAGETGDEPTQY